MDYEQLLIKYMVHLLDCEGSTLIHRDSEVKFTPEELWALFRAKDQVIEDKKRI